MEDLAVDTEAGVRHDGDRAVEQRVLRAVDMHVETGSIDGVPVPDRVDLASELREPASHALAGPQAQAGVSSQCGAHGILVEMIDVLVGDEHRRRLGKDVRARPDARVDDEPGAVLLQPDARMTELREEHEPSVPVTARPGRAAALPQLAWHISRRCVRARTCWRGRHRREGTWPRRYRYFRAARRWPHHGEART